jgi:hypothetical protein
MQKHTLTVLVLLLCACALGQAQSRNQDAYDSTFHNHHQLSLQSLQIKEAQNFGLVFTGAQLGYAYRWGWENDAAVSLVECGIGAAALLSKGILGVNIHLKPMEWQYRWKVSPMLTLGTLLMLEYDCQLYPDLQSGVSYWCSRLNVGVAAEYRFEAFQQNWRVLGSTSLLGFTSRPPLERSPYFFDLGFIEAVRYLHQNVRFGSVNQFSHTSIEFVRQPSSEGELWVSATLDIDAYFDAPRWIALRYGVKVAF